MNVARGGKHFAELSARGRPEVFSQAALSPHSSLSGGEASSIGSCFMELPRRFIQPGACTVLLSIGFSSLTAVAGPLPEPCRIDTPRAGVVAGLNPDGSLKVFDDRQAGRTVNVRLADVAVPVREQDASLDQVVRRWMGKSVLLHPISNRTDRWQRLVAHVELTARSTNSGQAPNGTASVPHMVNRQMPAWLQAELIATGAASVMPEGSATGCAAALYRDENTARRAGRGLWRKPGHRILSARDPKLAERAGAYRIVAGIVVSVGATSRRYYLNFGRDWSRDFTVTIPADKADVFRAAGRDPEALVGRYIRVRGWLERWNGAVIDVRFPDAIEVIGRGG